MPLPILRRETDTQPFFLPSSQMSTCSTSASPGSPLHPLEEIPPPQAPPSSRLLCVDKTECRYNRMSIQPSFDTTSPRSPLQGFQGFDSTRTRPIGHWAAWITWRSSISPEPWLDRLDPEWMDCELALRGYLISTLGLAAYQRVDN